jgi:hypothetical protein
MNVTPGNHLICPSMKTPALLAAIALLGALVSCDKTDPETARRLADLEAQAAASEAENAQLKQELAEQALAAERDAIERERVALEEQRLQLEELEATQAEQTKEDFANRGTELAERESRLQTREFNLSQQADLLDQRTKQLDEKDRDIAGREALIEESKVQPQVSEPEQPTGDYGTFHESLAPYGSWYETPSHGYVFQPVVVREVGWRPYTRGRWVCSSHGWTWVSDEPFGWATYHYGRWTCLEGRGWVWIPGTEWAPAWVTWRHGGNHTGWAPLPPETLGYTNYNWDSTVELTFGIGSSWFTYIETKNFCEPVRYHCLPYHLHHEHYGYTRNVSRIYRHDRGVFCGGPSYRDVNHRARRPVPYYNIEFDRYAGGDRSRIGSRPRVRNGVMTVAAPRIDAEWNAAIRPNKVRGKIERESVVGAKSVTPEIKKIYQESRARDIRHAETTINRHGGPQRFEAVRRQLIVNQDNRRPASRPAVAQSNTKPRQQTSSGSDIVSSSKSAASKQNPPSKMPATASKFPSTSRPVTERAAASKDLQNKPNNGFKPQAGKPDNQSKSASRITSRPESRITSASEPDRRATKQTTPRAEASERLQAEQQQAANEARLQQQRQAQQETIRRQQALQQERAANEARLQQQRQAEQETLRRQQAEQQQRAANKARLQQQRQAEQETLRRQQAEQQQRAANEARQQQQREMQQEQARRHEAGNRQRAEQQIQQQRAQAQRTNESRSNQPQQRAQSRNNDESNRQGKR